MFPYDVPAIMQLPREVQVAAFLEAAQADPPGWTLAAHQANFHHENDPHLVCFFERMSTVASPAVARAALAMLFRNVGDFDAMWRYVALWSKVKVKAAHRYSARHSTSYEGMLRGVPLTVVLQKLMSDPLPADHPVLEELRDGWQLPSFAVGDYRVHFQTNRAAILQVLLFEGGCEVRINTLGVKAANPLEGYLQACRSYQENALRLITTPTHRLSKEDVKEKGRLIGELDLMASDIGMHFRSERWLVVAVSEDGLLAREAGSDPMVLNLPTDMKVPGVPGDLLFAKVPVDRTGWPNGPVLALEQLVNLTNTEDLLEDLRTAHSLRQKGVP